MDVKEVKKYVGNRVLLILRNNFKYTADLPDFEGTTFTVKDRYGHDATINCNMVDLITVVGGSDDKNMG